ncbi:MAG: GNAT family N-acetyltransferase [Candidatus Latescibacteria bacterium]|jgi:ribosomal protein S18 acetylase RimI-like enzyme|nr:GNAT family N-acetyltransferase [Candidatus Latescibacterota bacterium]
MTNGFHIERVPVESRDQFRTMAETYWRDLMPDAPVCKSREVCDAYFDETFSWDKGNKHPFWALEDGVPVGFVSFEVEKGTAQLDGKKAYVHNFYVAAEFRRKGYGSAIVNWLFEHLDGLGIERLDLNVRRDTPNALAFWEAQGFGIAGYSMRMYRDPKLGTAFKGVLSSDFVDEE